MEKIILDENGNVQIQLTQKGQLIKTSTPEELGFFREKKFVYVFQRVALNPQTLKNISAPFLQIVQYKPKNRDGYDFYYFFFDAKAMSMPCVKNLDPRLGRFTGFTSSPNVQDTDFVRKIAAPKRLSREEFAKIMKDRVYQGMPFLGIFSEDGQEFVAPNPA